jgi:hypothetical protein
MEKIKEVLKSLRIRKEVNIGLNGTYRFYGYERNLASIEDKLEKCPAIKNISRMFLTTGYGYIMFELV